MRTLARGLVLVAALSIMGCDGSAVPSASTSAAPSRVRPSAVSAAAPREVGATTASSAVGHETCTSVVRSLRDDLDELAFRLSIGLALDAYATRVGAARFAYDRLLRDAWADGGIDARCSEKVVHPLASALNAYLAVYETWAGCVHAPHCRFDEGTDPPEKARTSWSRAAVLTQTAEAALRPAALIDRTSRTWSAARRPAGGSADTSSSPPRAGAPAPPGRPARWTWAVR